jgi:hypothetical protein
VVLANKLDGEIDASYVTIASPLFVSFSTLMLMSFGAKGANKCKYLTMKFIIIRVTKICYLRLNFLLNLLDLFVFQGGLG